MLGDLKAKKEEVAKTPKKETIDEGAKARPRVTKHSNHIMMNKASAGGYYLRSGAFSIA